MIDESGLPEKQRDKESMDYLGSFFIQTLLDKTSSPQKRC